MPFLSDPKIGGQLAPPPHFSIFSHAHFFLKPLGQNFEIAILFSIVEKSDKYVFEDDLIPQRPPEEVLQVVNFAHCLHIVLVIGKYTDVFRGIISGGRGVGGYLRGSFYGGSYQEGREFL